MFLHEGAKYELMGAFSDITLLILLISFSLKLIENV